MTLDEFRHEMASYRQSADIEAEAMKDPYVTLERLRTLYLKLEPRERQMAEQVLGEWVTSENEAIRFDAKALVNDLDIVSAVPALRELTKRLASSGAPSAIYETETANRLIEKLLGLNVGVGAAGAYPENR